MDFYYAEWQMRQKQRERSREVEASRLARQALAGGESRRPSLNASLARLGTWLEVWGCRLQARSGQGKAGDPASVACP